MSKNFCKLEKRWCNCCTNHGCIYICGKCAPVSSANDFRTLKTCPKRQYYRTVSLKELFKSTNFEDVWTSLVSWFPYEKNNKEGYKNAYNELRNIIKPKKFTGCDNYYLVVKPVHEDEDKDYLDVYLRKRGNTLESCSFGIDLMDWENLLYCNIDPICYNVKRDVTVPEIVAGALYEMTFFGYSLEDRKEKLKWTNIV